MFKFIVSTHFALVFFSLTEKDTLVHALISQRNGLGDIMASCICTLLSVICNVYSEFFSILLVHYFLLFTKRPQLYKTA